MPSIPAPTLLLGVGIGDPIAGLAFTAVDLTLGRHEVVSRQRVPSVAVCPLGGVPLALPAASLVLLGRDRLKVLDVDAPAVWAVVAESAHRWIVAEVVQGHSRRDRPVGPLPCRPMCQLGAVGSIATGVDATSPRDAVTHAVQYIDIAAQV